VGRDHRNRASLWAYGTKTGRNAPGSSQYVFGPSKWLRFLIVAYLAYVLVHRDYRQQEVRIAAVMSNDSALLEACESGDVYLGIADQLGFLRESMNDAERKAVRTLFKVVTLGIQYGLGLRTLALHTGLSHYEAGEILARLRARFHRFEDFTQSTGDHAGLDLEIGTQLGWWMQCPSDINPRTVRNFPIQSTASEILHVACVLAERRGVRVIAPIHDALLAEGPLDQAEELAAELDRAMGDASSIILRGYRLPTDRQLIRPGERYHDDRGATMWGTVCKLLSKLERESA
jgi:DNA polymerase-1